MNKWHGDTPTPRPKQENQANIEPSIFTPEIQRFLGATSEELQRSAEKEEHRKLRALHFADRAEHDAKRVEDRKNLGKGTLAGVVLSAAAVAANHGVFNDIPLMEKSAKQDAQNKAANISNNPDLFEQSAENRVIKVEGIGGAPEHVKVHVRAPAEN